MRSTACTTRRSAPRRGRQRTPLAIEWCGPSSAVLGPVVAPQEIGAELVEARAADLAHDEVDFAAEDVERLLDAGKPTRDGAVECRAAKEHELGAEAKGDQDVGAAAHTAIEHHGHLVADRRLDRRQ